MSFAAVAAALKLVHAGAAAATTAKAPTEKTKVHKAHAKKSNLKDESKAPKTK